MLKIVLANFQNLHENFLANEASYKKILFYFLLLITI